MEDDLSLRWSALTDLGMREYRNRVEKVKAHAEVVRGMLREFALRHLQSGTFERFNDELIERQVHHMEHLALAIIRTEERPKGSEDAVDAAIALIDSGRQFQDELFALGCRMPANPRQPINPRFPSEVPVDERARAFVIDRFPKIPSNLPLNDFLSFLAGFLLEFGDKPREQLISEVERLIQDPAPIPLIYAFGDLSAKQREEGRANLIVKWRASPRFRECPLWPETLDILLRMAKERMDRDDDEAIRESSQATPSADASTKNPESKYVTMEQICLMLREKGCDLELATLESHYQKDRYGERPHKVRWPHAIKGRKKKWPREKIQVFLEKRYDVTFDS